MTFHFLSGKKAENQIQEKRHITLISCYNITIMRTFNMNIFRKTKYIETQWHDDAGFQDAVKRLNEAGVDYVKFQTFKAEKLLLEDAPKANYQLQTTSNDETQLQMLKKLLLLIF